MARGTLRIYLGASPGVGKTFAMLNEGVRRRDRGADVVVGVVETHGRTKTAEQLRDLEVVPRRTVDHRGTVLHDMDLDAILARRPDVVLVDEYAHTNAPGGRHEKRWQDVEVLLDAGIDVISTVNIQHLESLNDVVAKITGVTQRETVPDAVVRRADQIELVDMSPEALRRRMAHGNIYPAERIDAALANFFRPGNLGALRELALLWLADRVEESLAAYMADQGIDTPWETRERVVVGITGAPGGDALIRRAARMAGRVGGDLVGVYITSDDGLASQDESAIAAQRTLIESLGGRAHEVVGHDRAEALVAFARAEKGTQLVIGATRRSRWYELLHGSLVSKVTRLAGDLDVHVIAYAGGAAPTSGRGPTRATPARRVLIGWVLAIVGIPLVTMLLTTIDERVELSTILLVFLVYVLGVAAVGGRLVAAVTAVATSIVINWFFVEPKYTLSVSEGENFVALVVFVIAALIVGGLVDRAASQSLEAQRARAEAAALARSAASLAADPDPVPALLEQTRVTFGLSSAQLVARRADGSEEVIGAVGDDVASTDIVTSVEVPAGDERDETRRLELVGRRLSTDDRRVIGLLAAQLAIAADTRELAAEAANAAALAEIDAVRTALLRAVSHDLRTPLSTIKALVTGVLDPTATWSSDELHEVLTSVDVETDRLNRLVGNLLDASRLQIGALALHTRPSSIADIVDGALGGLGREADDVQVTVPDDLPDVDVDPALLERSIANVVSNAVRHRHDATPVVVAAEAFGEHVHLRIIDRGPGIAVEHRESVLAPFQRLGDTNTVDGVGLGLAIARGFVEAMNGTLALDETPGGGLTVTISVPAVGGTR